MPFGQEDQPRSGHFSDDSSGDFAVRRDVVPLRAPDAATSEDRSLAVEAGGNVVRERGSSEARAALRSTVPATTIGLLSISIKWWAPPRGALCPVGARPESRNMPNVQTFAQKSSTELPVNSEWSADRSGCRSDSQPFSFRGMSRILASLLMKNYTASSRDHSTFGIVRRLEFIDVRCHFEILKCDFRYLIRAEMRSLSPANIV